MLIDTFVSTSACKSRRVRCTITRAAYVPVSAGEAQDVLEILLPFKDAQARYVCGHSRGLPNTLAVWVVSLVFFFLHSEPCFGAWCPSRRINSRLRVRYMPFFSL